MADKEPKIVILSRDQVPWNVLLHQILEQDGVEAVVCVVRRNGQWGTCWSNDTYGGLGLATMKLVGDVLVFINEPM